MADDNGGIPEATRKGQAVTRAVVPAPPGVHKFRYFTQGGLYIGELEFYAINEKAAKVIAMDLMDAVSGIVLPMAG
jgi:hypothetical protein